MEHILTIVGDENDADWLTQRRTVDLESVIKLPVLENHHGDVYSAETNLFNFLRVFALACKENPNHNWTRKEFDDMDAAGKTIAIVVRKLYGIEIEHLNDLRYSDTDQSDEAIELLFDFIQDYLPYGEFGIHTIESISYAPVDTETVIYKRERK